MDQVAANKQTLKPEVPEVLPASQQAAHRTGSETEAQKSFSPLKTEICHVDSAPKLDTHVPVVAVEGTGGLFPLIYSQRISCGHSWVRMTWTQRCMPCLYAVWVTVMCSRGGCDEKVF